MNIIFWGTPSFAVPCLEALLNSNHNVVGIVTQPDRRRGRGKIKLPSPIKELGIKYNKKIFTPNKIKEDITIQKEIINLNADIYIVVAFGQILPINIINYPALGSWNTHASLLPRWRGAGPIQWSLIKGDHETGVSIMKMEEGLDTGPILISEKFNIQYMENANSLEFRLSQLSAKLIMQTLEIISNNLDTILIEKQLKYQTDIDKEITYARQLKKNDFIIDWNNSSIDIHRKIMGLFPYCYTYLNNKRIKILTTEPMNNSDKRSNFILNNFNLKDKKAYKNGEIIKILQNKGLLVMAGDEPIVISSIQLEGRKPSSGSNMINQLKTIEGDTFNSSS